MVDPKLLNPQFITAARAKFLSDNCVKLAEFLETVPDRNHNQIMWKYHRNDCGTVCCAMGWAVEANLIEVEKDADGFIRSSYVVEGARFYGQRAVQEIFLNTHASKVKTINALYREAERLCDEAKRLKAAEAGGPVRAQIR